MHLKLAEMATRATPPVTCEYEITLSHYAAGSLAMTDLRSLPGICLIVHRLILFGKSGHFMRTYALSQVR